MTLNRRAFIVKWRTMHQQRTHIGTGKPAYRDCHRTATRAFYGTRRNAWTTPRYWPS